jgi:hypothetical protein
MSKEMRTISLTRRCRKRLLQVETDLGIINIWVGLHDQYGGEVERIEIRPDDGVSLDGSASTRLIYPFKRIPKNLNERRNDDDERAANRKRNQTR